MALTYLFADNAVTTLAGNGGAVPAGSTILKVTSSSLFPAPTTGQVFQVLIDSEIITVTNVNGLAWTVNATTAVHNDGAGVALKVTAAALQAITAAANGTAGSTPDATASTKGIVQLSGDLAGTAAAPTVPGLATKAAAATTVNGHPLSADVTVTAGDVGLGNVNNTSDAAKPVSTAQQTALNLKAPITNPSFTGTVTLAADPTANMQAATKQYVDNSGAVIVDATFNGSQALGTGQTLANIATSTPLTLAANATYLAEGLLVYTADSTGRAQFAATVPSGATISGLFVGTLQTATSGVATPNRFYVSASGVSSPFAGFGNATIEIPRLRITTGSTSGALVFQGAQNASGGSGLTINGGGVTLTRIA